MARGDVGSWIHPAPGQGLLVSQAYSQSRQGTHDAAGGAGAQHGVASQRDTVEPMLIDGGATQCRPAALDATAPAAGAPAPIPPPASASVRSSVSATPASPPSARHGGRTVAVKDGHHIELGAEGQGTCVRVDGIFDCIVVAMRGTNPQTHEKDLFVAHLDSQQYLPQGPPVAQGHLFNGWTDDMLKRDDEMTHRNRAGAVKATRAFARGHRDLEVLAATNYLDHGVNVGRGLYAKLAISPPPTLHFLAEGSSDGGCVELDADAFELHKVHPKTHERIANVRDLPTVDEARATAPVRPSKSAWQKLGEGLASYLGL